MNRAEILDTARQAVMIDRAATHGDAENTFAAIAALWSARLRQQITPAQVAIMLVDLKTARAWGNPCHGDNWVDMAGYAACGGELATVTAEPDSFALDPAPTLPEQIAPAAETPAPQPARAKPLRNPARTLQREKFKPGPAWTPEEIDRAIELATRGFTIAEIAAKLGRPEHGTRKKLGQHSAEVKARAAALLDARQEPGESEAAPDATPAPVSSPPAPQVAQIRPEVAETQFPASAALKTGVLPKPPCHGFTPEMDADLIRYMRNGLGIGGAASMLKLHRDKVAARWAHIEAQQQEAAE